MKISSLWLLIACLFIMAQSCAKKNFEVKGNIQITNNCSGTISDTIIVKFVFIDNKKTQVDKDTALVVRKDEFYPFKKTSNVNEDAVVCRITEVTDYYGKPICEAARNTICIQPQKCKGSLTRNTVVNVGELMLADVSCNCAN